jgi:glycosyltransferase involved in cell wall biosynthesis
MTDCAKTDLKVSIIIPVRNDAFNLRACLESLFQTNYANFECIVVDDCSTDDTALVAENFAVQLLRSPKQRGPAHARNLGASVADGDILFFIDSDVMIFSDTVAKIAEVFRTKQSVAAVIGSYDDRPAHPAFISQYKNLFHHWVHQNLSRYPHTFWAACGAIRRKVFAEVGGFDQRYRQPSIEDIEMGFRLTAQNKTVVLEKNIRVKHLKRWTFWTLLKTDICDRGIPWTKLLIENRSLPNDLNLANSQRICVLLTYLFFLTPSFSFTAKYLAIISFITFSTIVLINARFYKFFLKSRGVLFAIRVLPMHLLYYLYSGLSFVLGMAGFIQAKLLSRREAAPAINLELMNHFLSK